MSHKAKCLVVGRPRCRGVKIAGLVLSEAISRLMHNMLAVLAGQILIMPSVNIKVEGLSGFGLSSKPLPQTSKTFQLC